MIKFDVCIESGTSGYFDDMGCDMLLKRDIETNQIPSKGDCLYLDKGYEPYLVTKVRRSFMNNEEWNTVYVIKG